MKLRTLVILVALTVAAGCRQKELTPAQRLAAETHASDIKVIIIGIDGATFRVLDPLIDAGELPVLDRLISRGARGTLRSQKPTRSPRLWTTIATGKKPAEHGIVHFRLPSLEGESETEVLATSHHRRSLALWNLMGVIGKTVGFLGWWVTWPAEPVNGWMVSDRLTHSRWVDWTDGSRNEYLTFPEGLTTELAELTVDPLDPPMDEVDSLVELTPDEREEFLAASRPIFAHALSVFKFAYCNQRSYEEMALHMLAKGQPDLTGIFLIANDPISHTFWHFYESEKFKGIDRERAERLGQLIPAFQRHNDRFLGRLLTNVDPNTVVLIISDHGFKASGRVPKERPAAQWADRFDELWEEAHEEGVVAVGQSGQHTMNGMLVASGGPIRKGVEVRANLYDIAPTVLALMGLPVPEDMEGRVLEEIIEPDFLARYPVQTIDSYSTYLDLPTVAATDSATDEEALEMLRSLGYIQ